jgi:ribokinase
MQRVSDILVIGDAVLDVSVAPEDEPRPGADVPAAVGAAPGGQGANIAVRLARRRVPVRLACALGEDVAGRIVRHALSAEGVVLEAAVRGSGVVVILVAADGERTMFSRRIPLLPLSVDTTAAWTIVSGYVLLEDGELTLNDCGGRIAVVGCALPDGAASDWWLRARNLRPDLVVMNAEEARAVGGADASTLAVDSGALVVVTEPDGAQSASADPDLPVRRIRVDVVPAVDTTGAGDAFAAALVAELRQPPWPPAEAELDAAMTTAAALAAQVARVPGAQARVASEGPA